MDAVHGAAHPAQTFARPAAHATKPSEDPHPSAPPRGENQSSSLLLELSEGQGTFIDTLTQTSFGKTPRMICRGIFVCGISPKKS